MHTVGTLLGRKKEESINVNTLSSLFPIPEMNHSVLSIDQSQFKSFAAY